jgi:hypothetical protein
MSDPFIELPFDLLSRLLLSGVAPDSATGLRAALLAFTAFNSTGKQQLLRAFDALKGGPCLPFELGEDERIVAHAMLASWHTQVPGRLVLFSALSQTDAGAVILGDEGKLEWRDVEPIPVTVADSWLYPASAPACLAALRGQDWEMRRAQLDIGKTLSLRVPVSARAATALAPRCELSASLWNRDFDESSRQWLRSCRWQVDAKRREILMELHSPEDILRFTAAAELHGWLRIAGDAFGGCVRLAPLDAAEAGLSVICGGPAPEPMLVHDVRKLRLTFKVSQLPQIWPYFRHNGHASNPKVMQAAVQAGLTET